MASAITELLKWAVSIIGPAAGDPRTAASVRTPLGQLADRTKWLKRGYDALFGAEQQIIGRAGNILEITAHALPSNTAVTVFATSGGTLPAPLAANTVYYVRVVDADHIELSATSGPGAAITLTADGSGDQWLATTADWISSLIVSDVTYGSGAFKNLVVWLAGSQTVTGAKTFADLTMSGTNKVKLAARSRTRPAGNGVVIDDVGASLPTSSAAVGTDVAVFIPLDPPDGSTITAFRVRIDPAVHANLPGSMPQVALQTIAVDGTVASLETVADTSPDAAAYSAAHNIEKLGISVVVDRSLYRYRLNLLTESGDNSAAGDVIGASYDLTPASYDDAAG